MFMHLADQQIFIQMILTHIQNLVIFMVVETTHLMATEVILHQKEVTLHQGEVILHQEEVLVHQEVEMVQEDQEVNQLTPLTVRLE